MKILLLADHAEKSLWDNWSSRTADMLSDVRMILSAGDLDAGYLEFLVTMSGLPLFYVHGNHDEKYRREPEGCICIDDRIVILDGVRILGLGGSYRYRKGKYLYTERMMRNRILRLYPALLFHKGFDMHS